MAAYSIDLRERVLKDWDRGLKADDVAEKYSVSRAWVHRLVQRRRETGEIGPRKQTRFRPLALAGHEERLRALVAARPDQTLAELRTALPTTASLGTIWRTLERLDLSFKKNGLRHRTTSAGHHGRAAPVARVAAVLGGRAVRLPR